MKKRACEENLQDHRDQLAFDIPFDGREKKSKLSPIAVTKGIPTLRA